MESSPKQTSRFSTTLRLTDEQRAKIKTLAPMEGRSRNNLIIKMLREGLAKRRQQRDGNAER